MRIRALQSLSFRIFLFQVFIFVVFIGLFAYLSIYVHKKQMTAIEFQNVRRDSDIIKRSIHYDMLLNRRKDVYKIMQTIGNEPEMVGIRIYNDVGVVTFSTDSSEMGSRVNMQTEACYLCHLKNKPLAEVPVKKRYRIYNSPDGYRVIGLINPIRNEPSCSSAACHAHPAKKKILGVLDVLMSLKTVDQSIERNKHNILMYAGLVIILVLFPISVFIYIMVYRPVQRLIDGTKEVAHGNLDYAIQVSGKNEFAHLAYSFNRMTKSLKKAREELTKWSETLEKKVDEKTKELKNAQGHLIQVEKMASLGKLAATVAHELNNPLAGVLTYVKLFEKQIKKSSLKEDQKNGILENLGIIESEIKRSGDIVKNLLLFARGTGENFEEKDINGIIQKSILLLNHKLKISNINLVTQYCYNDCTILCNENQIKQALVAILVNAADAMPEGGTLTISTQRFPAENTIEIKISDTGIGIPEDVLPHIFEPFYTTKKEGTGVGLGLSVVYGIIQRHQGTIHVESKPGKGTTFYIKLPRHPKVPKESLSDILS
ncbi:sporulation kinase E [bacterium BMS3Abin05]|nr:sporulation kinase E [bacterium BMS3Abin05]GBE28373.1 sporulation kinase E [bacterium BMS3Bbin03]HDK35465.1 HAMP domain-containing protein [Bacteroidota bacterium]HDZ11160.1 HAMP domain-containing protein [Bacteroidota bacterium]